MLSRLLKEHQAKQNERKELQEKRRREAITAATCLTEALVDHLNVGKSGMWRTGLGALSWTCAPLPPPWNTSTKDSCSQPSPSPSSLPLYPSPPTSPWGRREADRPRIKHKPPFLCGMF
ncbi:biogenesis of lysosome-related organelles complex 1 subunit 1 isoform X2 [Rousettus aegyptiacus]|uniref:biogenesis of lysosome-related organelles complex 1 subunit 1 isoform X2 n=1 Tax=Rousettus aegyptiacus TaxID=9407 RepID=UPI00168D760C|nr:biogenesis of lysosome-related organelles complex 1 subunit 1 isoform X2 [Rousettus aegyptiacus]